MSGNSIWATRRDIVGTCSIEVERFFGPVVQGCLDDFDFTLLFEESILSIGPTALLLLAIPPRLYHLGQRPRKARQGISCALKLATLVVYAALQLWVLVTASLPSTPTTLASIPAAALSFVAAIALCFLSYQEHVRSVRPSSLLLSYMLFSMLGDIIRSRTLWAIQDERLLAIAVTTVTAWKAVVIAIESVEKRRLVLDQTAVYPPEAIANVWSTSIFWWLNPLLIDGFRKELDVNQLYENDKGLLPEKTLPLLDARWSKANQSKPNALLWVFVVQYKWALAAAVLPRLALLGFKFAQPYLVQRAVTYSAGLDDTADDGYGLIAACAVVYLGIAISDALQQHMTYRCITMTRGTLVNLIYQKTLRLNTAALDRSAALTLMSADVDRIQVGLRTMHELWASPIGVALSIWLLTTQIGVSTVAAALTTVVCMGFAVLVAGGLGPKQSKWLESIQTRVEATAGMLGSMQIVKMSGLTEFMARSLTKLREAEIASSFEFRSLLVKIVALSYSSTALAPVFAFGTFAIIAEIRGTPGLNITMLFPTLLLFELLATPIVAVIDTMAGVMPAIAAFSRIQAYIAQEDHFHTVFLDGGSDRDVSVDDCEKVSQSSASSSENSYSPADGDDKEHATQPASFDYLSEKPTSNVTVEPSPRTEKGGENMVKRTQSERQSPQGQILVSGGNFSTGWSNGDKLVLRDLNFSIQRAQLTMVIGPVGCGKSTLIQAMLDETPYTTGTLSRNLLDGDIAYANQTAWLVNGTVRQNVLGPASDSLDQSWYDTVLAACALDVDLKQLPHGDETVLGNKGATLSGGQQQRLCVARAVYSRKPLIILDDVFSGLDANTESRMFESLLGSEGLLRKSGTSVVLATHNLSFLPSADHIIALAADGEIAAQGNFQVMETKLDSVRAMMRKRKGGKQANAMPATDKPTVTATGAAEQAAMLNGAESTASERRMGDFTVYGYYMQACTWWTWVILLFFAASYGFGAVFPQVWIEWWATANQEDPNTRLAYYLAIYAFLNVATVLILYGAAFHLVNNIVPKVALRMHQLLLNTAINAPISFFHNTETGITLNRFAQDLQLIDLDLPLALINVIVIAFVLIAQVLVIAITGKYVIAAIAVGGVVIFFVQSFYLRTTRQLRYLDIDAKAPLFTHFLETLDGLATIRAFGWQREYNDTNQAILNLSQRPNYLLFCIQRWLGLSLDFIVAGIAIVLMVIIVAARGQVTSGLIGLALVNIASFSTSLKDFITNWTLMETSVGAVARIRAFVKSTDNENAPDTDDTAPKSIASENWPEKGAIEISGIWASYKPEKPVLKGISLNIEAGQRIGICGRSGSGKSSLVSCLTRMLDLDRGSVCVDGVDISTLSRESVRLGLNVISQQPLVMLESTLRANIDPFESASDEEVIDALQQVDLWRIVSEEGGLAAIITAKTFSHGQRQLLSLARALLRRKASSVLVLDEVSASVDLQTDKVMQAIIRKSFSTHTILAVAHRLDTIVDFDRIAVFDNGNLIEFATPGELLDRPSAFRDLYQGEKAESGEGEEDDDEIEVIPNQSN